MNKNVRQTAYKPSVVFANVLGWVPVYWYLKQSSSFIKHSTLKNILNRYGGFLRPLDLTINAIFPLTNDSKKYTT